MAVLQHESAGPTAGEYRELLKQTLTDIGEPKGEFPGNCSAVLQSASAPAPRPPVPTSTTTSSTPSSTTTSAPTTWSFTPTTLPVGVVHGVFDLIHAQQASR